MDRGFHREKQIPQDVRNKVLQRSKGCCEDCGLKTSTLELHHLTYQRNVRCKGDMGASIFGYEETNDLVALCRECHYNRHKLPCGDFEKDIDEVNSQRMVD